MKPRIRRAGHGGHRRMGRLWECAGSHWVAYGATPREAYEVWLDISARGL